MSLFQLVTSLYYVSTNVWEFVQKAVDLTKVKVAAMKGKRLPRFSSQLVVLKLLIPDAEPVPVFPSKKSSTSKVSSSSPKKPI
ncbi:hypothetical protein LIER_04816 [Lithospermum erythrorhizon]|uniref:Uncharacterized protein n=1 Tax=Lithospermum erythrorhizon TaxID=34254 RepID=A0AAV3NYD0_LITER